ncbi:MAG: hypothetical protein KF823_14440 [Xanthomonadales bacterium]|nr:hypothetical protein [Xanthomonadales bacterium]
MEPCEQVPVTGAKVVDLADVRRRCRPGTPVPAVPLGMDVDSMIITLGDAVQFLFHLRALGREPAAQRDLERAVRVALACHPLSEDAEILADTWDSIRDLNFLEARVASVRRFEARNSED